MFGSFRKTNEWIPWGYCARACVRVRARARCGGMCLWVCVCAAGDGTQSSQMLWKHTPTELHAQSWFVFASIASAGSKSTQSGAGQCWRLHLDGGVLEVRLVGPLAGYRRVMRRFLQERTEERNACPGVPGSAWRLYCKLMVVYGLLSWLHTARSCCLVKYLHLFLQILWIQTSFSMFCAYICLGT